MAVERLYQGGQAALIEFVIASLSPFLGLGGFDSYNFDYSNVAAKKQMRGRNRLYRLYCQ
jgi:hypothetical protein